MSRWMRIVALTLGVLWMTGAFLSLADTGSSGFADRFANLLVNAGAEAGSNDRPIAWQPVQLPGSEGQVLFSWEDEASHSGSRSLRIDSAGSGRGIWSQTIPVDEGEFYEISGYVAFEALPPTSDCHLQVVFRNAAGDILEFVDLARHDSGSRGFDLDFPARMILRAPSGAAQAEVNGYLSGRGTAWFDDLRFAPAPVGTILGRVTSEGRPIAGARVSLWGDPWGEPSSRSRTRTARTFSPMCPSRIPATF